MFLKRIMRGIATIAIALSLFIGDILLFPSIALAKPSHLAGTVAINSSTAELPADPFDRNGDPAGVGKEFQPPIPLEDCFWQVTVGSDPFFNAYYTDAQAYYPSAVFSVEPGGYVEVKGDFPHARSFTLTADHYDKTSPTNVGSSHQLSDFQIIPDEGSSNPFLDGADRTIKNRSYTLKWLPEALPEDPTEREPNTLYLSENEFPGTGFIVVMRVYLPDQGTNFLGGTTLPEATIVNANDTRINGDEICATTSFTGNIPFPSAAFNEAEYLQERDNPDKPKTWPAQNPPYINREFTVPYNFCLNFVAGPGNEAVCGPNPEADENGPGFANPANAYLLTWMDRKLGEVLVLRGKKPKTPTTYFGDSTFDTSDAELLYLSFTTEESLYTWRVADSVFDEEIPVDEDGYYTVVVSRPSYRPNNARFDCGYAWLEFPAAGDGAGDIHLAELKMRWQKPLNDFDRAPQNVTETGQESEVMGEYFPTGEYMTPPEFDGRFSCQG